VVVVSSATLTAEATGAAIVTLGATATNIREARKKTVIKVETFFIFSPFYFPNVLTTWVNTL
jgi:hypothetical protein